MRTVLRIAHVSVRHATTKQPLGPYSLWAGEQPVDMYPSLYGVSYINSPTPDNDGIGHMDEDLTCGFRDMEQMTGWFGPAFDSLTECDFGYYEVAVPEDSVFDGEKQVCYEHKFSTIIGFHRLPPSTEPHPSPFD